MERKLIGHNEFCEACMAEMKRRLEAARAKIEADPHVEHYDTDEGEDLGPSDADEAPAPEYSDYRGGRRASPR